VEIDSVRVSVRGNIYIPNAFSPDGDGLNDIFKAKGIDIVEFKMEIFDRWGELVFKSDRIENGWNGAKLDSDYYAQSGMYTYTVVAREAHGEIFEIIGHVMLLR
jgi:gliding motility-associated-like protein